MRTVASSPHVESPPARNVVQVPPMFEPVMGWLDSVAAAHIGTSGVRLEPVRYEERPFSHVLKVAVRPDTSVVAERHLYVKLFKCASPKDLERIRGRVAREFEQTSDVHRAMSRWQGLGTIRPVACSPELLVSVTEEAPGTTLLAYLESRVRWRGRKSPGDDLASTMGRVGRWLQAFQTVAPSGGRTTVDAVRSYVDLRLVRLTELPRSGFTQADRERVLSHIARLGDRVDAADLEEVAVHGDLALGNILVSADRITVLDFPMMGTGSRLHDLTRLYTQIELMALKPQFRRSVLRTALASLLQGFDVNVTTRRPMFRLLSLQHRINHLATLSVSQPSFPTSAYNWHVRRAHRSWIERELRMSERGA